jgi:RNA polymerase primary sigma factor
MTIPPSLQGDCRDSSCAWLHSAGRVPQGSSRLDISRGQQIRAADDPNATPAQRRAAARARNRMIQQNLRLVACIAKPYQARIQHSSALEFADLLQAGTIGLIRAVEKFDPSLGYSFSTYAFWWIRQSIRREIEASDGCIRLSARLHQLKLKAHFAPADLNPQQLADHLQLTRQQADELLEIMQLSRVDSLDRPVEGSDERLSLGDCLAAPPDPSLHLVDLRQAARRLRQQSPAELDILERILQGESQTDVARSLGISRQALNRRLSRATKRLRLKNPAELELLDALA